MFNKPVAQPCANGFVSLLLALQCHGITKGDFVLVPTFTMVAVPNAVVFLGAIPVFADNSPGCYNPGTREYLAAAERVDKLKIKALITAHTYSVPADILSIVALCKKNGWALIEDISEGIGCKYNDQYLGSYGDYSCASMYANKALTSGDGGFVISDNPRAAKRLTSIINHGFTPRYHFVHPESCINGKMNGLAAALVLPAVTEIGEVTRQRKFMAKCYRQYLAPYAKHVTCMPVAGDEDTPWVFGIEVKNRNVRNELRQHLATICGIETRNYFVCLHDQSAWARNGGTQDELFPNALNLAERGLYLPSHYWLTESDIMVICNAVGAYFTNTSCDSHHVQHRLTPKVIVNSIGNLESIGPKYLSRKEHFIALGAIEDLMKIRNLFTFERENWSACVELQKSLASKMGSPCLSQGVHSQIAFYADFLHKLLENNHILPVSISQDPWIGFEVTLNSVPTTTSSEVQQLLCWLISQHKCKFVVEMGTWLGGTSILLLNELRNTWPGDHHLLVVDGFRWQEWMNGFVDATMQRGAGKPFYNTFKEFLQQHCGETNDLTSIQVPTEIHNWKQVKWAKAFSPAIPCIDLLYFDITTDYDEMVEVIRIIEPNLADNALIVINMYGISTGVCKFVATHMKNLKPLYKPRGFIKVFNWNKSATNTAKSAPPQKVCFTRLPDWNHHRNGSFCDVMTYAREHLHDSGAIVLFIPAVENYLCNHNELPITDKWMGILHQPEHSNTPWVMDLSRLVRSPQFLASLPSCLGLYTLSSYLRDYVASNLPAKCTVPVCRLFYPLTKPISAPIEQKPPSQLVLVGEFMRNFNDFLKLRSYLPKVWLVGVSVMATPERLSAAKAAGIVVQERLEDDKYQEFLTNSVVFLSLAADGIASTLLVECICSNTPILLQRYAIGREYLGKDYPLFFDNLDQAEELLTIDKIAEARGYLNTMDKLPFSPDYFVEKLVQSAPYQCAPVKSTVDVTVCLISYKRTYNIPHILQALLFQQDNASSRCSYGTTIMTAVLKLTGFVLPFQLFM